MTLLNSPRSAAGDSETVRRRDFASAGTHEPIEFRRGAHACDCEECGARSAADGALVKLRDARGSSFITWIVFYTDPATLALTDRIWAVPISALWASGKAA